MKRPNTSVVLGGSALVGMGLVLLSQFNRLRHAQQELARVLEETQQTRDKATQLALYDPEKLTQERERLEATLPPLHNASQLIERFTKLGQQEGLSFLDITSTVSELSEEELNQLGTGQFLQRLRLLSIEMVWEGVFRQIVRYVQVLTRFPEVPLLIREVVVARDPAREGRLKIKLAVHTLLVAEEVEEKTISPSQGDAPQ